MDFTGERFVPIKDLMNDEIAFEHLHRYHNSLNIVKAKVVLDLACGEGYGTAILAESAQKVFGVDIDEASIIHAKNTYQRSNIEFRTGTATNIPLPDNSIDVVISYETIEHIDEQAQNTFLREIKRVLKNEGKLIISTPDKENYTERYSHANEFHVKEFRKEEFVTFLNQYFEHTIIYSQGFEIVDAITEEAPEKIRAIDVIDWPRNSQPFSRKYLLAVCSDISFRENLNFSSVVFQVNKNYLDIMSTLIDKEKHIIELGNWGKKLDKEIAEKDDYIRILQRAEEENSKSINSENYYKELIRKQVIAIENLSSIQKENERLRTKGEAEKREIEILKTSLLAAQENIKYLEQSHSSVKTNLAERDIIVTNQSQTISFLKNKVEESSDSIRSLESKENDNETIILKQKEKEQNLYLQLEKVNSRLNEIYESDGWRLLKKYYNIKGRVLREDSKRYKFLKNTINAIRGKKEAVQYGTPNREAVQIKPQPAQEPIINYDVISFHKYEQPAVSIIIPVFNGWEVTYRCLRSIHIHTTAPSFEIIVADDGATDETKNIEQYIKNIHVIRNETNLGFLNNCNNAAKKARGKYILFLNNDTEVRAGWLSALTDLLDRDNSIGMAGSKLLYPDGKLQEAGGIIWKDASAWNFGHKQDPEAPQFNYLKEADYISGAAIIIRSSLWKEIGGFDTRYSPAYCEDSDLAFEVRKKGFKVVYQPLSEVIHYEGYSHGTDGQQGAIKEYQKINNLKLKEKWHDVLQKDHFPNGENVFWARDKSRYKQTILVVDHYVPHFDKDAGSKTVFQYLSLFVSMNLNVKFIGDNFYKHEPYTNTLQQMGIEVLYGPWYAQNWQQWIKDNQDKFDYVLLNRPHITIKYIDFIRENTKAKILYYGHDLHFVREMKQYEIEKNPALLKSAENWKRIETDIFKKSDIVLAPSVEESKQIKGLGIESVLPIKPYIFSKLKAPIRDFSNRSNLLFVGGFSHSPNVDAVLWFANEIWPTIKRKIPSLKFIIAGSNPPLQITSLANGDIEVLGYLSDEELDKVYNKIRVVVIPLRFGAGVKGKTIEAMYHGIPVVTTSFGIEGLSGVSTFVPATNNANDFANRVAHLYNATDEELTDLSKNETTYIKENFHSEIVKSEMLSVLNILNGEKRNV